MKKLILIIILLNIFAISSKISLFWDKKELHVDTKHETEHKVKNTNSNKIKHSKKEEHQDEHHSYHPKHGHTEEDEDEDNMRFSTNNIQKSANRYLQYKIVRTNKKDGIPIELLV